MSTTTTTTTAHDPLGEVMDALLTVAGRVLLGGFVLAWWAVLFPMISLPVAATVAAWVLLGWPAGLAVAGVAAVGMTMWWRLGPRTFRRWVTGRIRSRFLAWFRYRRRWVAMLAACDLTTRDGDRVLVPRLVSVEIGDTLDTLHARMLPGHSPETWTNRTEHLAHGFGAQQVRIRFSGPGQLAITLRRRDALADPVVVPFESIAGFKDVTRDAA